MRWSKSFLTLSTLKTNVHTKRLVGTKMYLLFLCLVSIDLKSFICFCNLFAGELGFKSHNLPAKHSPGSFIVIPYTICTTEQFISSWRDEHTKKILRSASVHFSNFFLPNLRFIIIIFFMCTLIITPIYLISIFNY